MSSKPSLLEKWLDFLHVLNIEQFGVDIWKAMLKSHERSPELHRNVLRGGGNFQFCIEEIKEMFFADGGAA